MDEPNNCKIDALLLEALKKAAPDEEIRIIATLDTGTSRTTEAFTNIPTGKLLSRAELRRHAIKQYDASADSAMQDIMTTLRNIGLTVRGSGLVGALVLDGTPTQLRHCLELPAMTSATLDRPIDSTLPARWRPLP